jgi:phospholipid/cholesterol/gamma-HCH transport system substrate-binding protein
VIIDLKPGTPVRTDTSATLIGSLITNIRFVQLTGGSEKSAMLEEGGLIPAESTGFDEIQEQATVIAKQLTDTLAQVQRDVLTKDNIASIGTAIHDLALTSADLHHTLSMLATPRTVASLQALLANANQALIGIQQAAAVVSSLKGEVNSTMAELQKTVQHGDTLMKEASLTVGHLDLVVSQNQDELSRLLSNLADASLSLGQAGDVIRDDPSRLVWGNNLPVKEIPDK